MPRYLVCITGASGAVYGIRLLQILARSDAEIHLVASSWGERVVAEETGLSLSVHLAGFGAGRIRRHDAEDLSAPPASGSFRFDACAIAPCSTATLGAMATGAGRNLIHRAGAVALKEGWPLVLAPRETPLSLIDLRNMTSLAEAGAAIVPACPGFYNRPESLEELVDGFVSKLLDRMGADNPLASPWTGKTGKGAGAGDGARGPSTKGED
jgi:4-hydroxy-3-polyprenylbenzoate decarboxylase